MEEETCNWCVPIPRWGVVAKTDIRYIGGFVDDNGIRHDPYQHQSDCPIPNHVHPYL